MLSHTRCVECLTIASHSNDQLVKRHIKQLPLLLLCLSLVVSFGIVLAMSRTVRQG